MKKTEKGTKITWEVGNRQWPEEWNEYGTGKIPYQPTGTMEHQNRDLVNEGAKESTAIKVRTASGKVVFISSKRRMELEKRYIVEVLEATNGNKSQTAEILGISRAALWRKLKQLKAEQTG